MTDEQLGGLGFGIPTRVGMDRLRSSRPSAPTRNPHACGDGPAEKLATERADQESPRVWGWTEFDLIGHGARHGIPTRVGMDRYERGDRAGVRRPMSARSPPGRAGRGPSPCAVWRRRATTPPRPSPGRTSRTEASRPASGRRRRPLRGTWLGRAADTACAVRGSRRPPGRRSPRRRGPRFRARAGTGWRPRAARVRPRGSGRSRR